MIKPGISKYDWEVELSDSKSNRKFGLKIAPNSLQIGTISQDDTVYVRSVGKRIGDFDEQRNWKGGRGLENLSENPEGFNDSQNMWTLTTGHAHQTLQWYHARGLRSEDLYMPTRSAGSVKFQPLLGSTLYIANSFSASSSYSADKGYLWIRRKGAPSTLTFRLMSNSGGNPNTALKTVTKSISDVTDYIRLYQVFDWTTTESLTSSTTYWVSVHGASTDNKDNHWEIGVNPDASSGKTSSDGTTWSSASFAMYYRITDTDTERRWFRFVLRDAMYIIDSKDDKTTASVLYINGDRGKLTSATSNTFVDTAKSWVTDRWANAYIKITAGTGKGQIRLITANQSNGGAISTNWATTPSTDSEYIIYGTEWFTQVTPTGSSLSVCSGEPAIVNNVAYIPQGTTAINHLRFDSSVPGHELSVETVLDKNGLADLLISTNDSDGTPVIWRVNNSGTITTGSGGVGTASKARLLDSSGAFIAWNAQLPFAVGIFTGSSSYLINGINKKDKSIYVFREDGMGIILDNKYNVIDAGIEKTPDSANGSFSMSHGGFMYYSWLHSVVRIFSSSHDDIGDDYRSVGLPDGREGVYADGDTYLKLAFFGVDAGSGTSSVLAWDGLTWHEMVRGRQTGDRIRFCKVQTCQNTRNRLWTQMGGDLVFQELPYKKASPRLDTGARFMHEGVLTSAIIDMGTASAMPKLINNLVVTVKNLTTNGNEVYLYIQKDENTNTNNWIPVGVMSNSPESVKFLGLNCNRFAYRLQVCSSSNSTIVDIEGVVPNGYARVPYKMVFSMQIQAGGIFTRRGKMVTADYLMRWLLDEARIAGFVNMSSVFELAHGWKVIVHPPRQFPLTPRKGRNPESAAMTLTLQEV